MNPLDFLRDNIFYNDARTKQINNAMRRNSGQSSNPIRPSQPSGEPTAYAQHAGTSYYTTNDERDVYSTPSGEVYDYKTGQQIVRVGDERGTHDGAFSLDGKKTNAYVGTNVRNIDNQIIDKGTQVWKVPDSTKSDNGDASNSGRGDKRTNAAGVTQTGTNMNRSFNDLLATTNTSGYVPFSSNQLPTTAGSPDSNIGPVTDGVVYADMLQNSPGYGTVGVGPLADGDAYARAVEGKGKSPSRLDTALSDTAGINSYMSKFSSGDKERLANRAFLDTEDSMLALRAKEAVNNVVYAGGQHYVPGESADSPAVAINRSDARNIANNKAKAEDFKAKKVAETVAAVKQSPTVLQKIAKDTAFTQDKPQYSDSTPAIGGQIEFEDSNPKNTPAFGKTGGYSSGFTRIDTSMTNPFG